MRRLKPMDLIEDGIDFVFKLALILMTLAIPVCMVAGIVVMVPCVTGDCKKSEDPVAGKIRLCESRAAEILGGSPQFERGTEAVKDDKYTITGKVTTTFDNTDSEKTYTCTVETIDGESIAKIDSIE